MSKFNLTAVALNNKSILIYFIICVFIGGFMSFKSVGRMENPDLTIRQMVITVAWPGSTTTQMQDLVLDKIERKLQETPSLDNIKSYAGQGQGVIYVTLDGECPQDEVKPIWQLVRNLTAETVPDLPQGVIGPFFNDRFDDIFGSVYALTGEGYSYEQKREVAEQVRRRLLLINNVKRVELLGVQEEKVYIEIDPAKLARIGLSAEYIQQAVNSYSGVTTAGTIETEHDNVYLRISGITDKIDDIRNIPLSVGGPTIRLADIANIRRGYAEPADPKMYFNGREAIGIALSMAPGGNIITLAKDLKTAIDEIAPNIPVGLEVHQVVDQPQIVSDSINEFGRSIVEAVILLLIVSFLSLGLRMGLVISLCIPLVFAGVFIVMRLLGIDLHSVSLGTLIIALGLLVDDEIIAVEMMAVKIEEGMNKFDAACAAYRITAMPMLSGTLITCAGFIPIGFAKGDIADFTSMIFPVLVAALLISWIVSVTAVPFLGHMLVKIKSEKQRKEGRFYRIFKAFLIWCLTNRKKVIIATILCFCISLYSMKYIKQEFFPPSKRGELIIDLCLPDGSSIEASDAVAKRLSDYLATDDNVTSYSYYVGEGAPRFASSVEPFLPSPNISQFIVMTNNSQTRQALSDSLRTAMNDVFPEVRVNIRPISMGPPMEYPVILRVSGIDADKVQDIASAVVDTMSENSNFININLDWHEMSRTISLRVDQGRLATLGIDRRMLAEILHSNISGATIGEYYDRDRRIDITFKLTKGSINTGNLENIPVSLSNGNTVPLSQLVYFDYGSEAVSAWRRNLQPTVTIRADVVKGTPNDTTQAAYDQIKPIRDNLPLGYSIEVAGALENSNTSMAYLLEQIPLMIFVIVTILMLQLKRFSLMLMALLTAPLGLIGVSISMLAANQPMGFVATLGIIALSGMVIRNAVILIDQINKHLAEGDSGWEAIIKSVMLRFRPIMLTTITAILSMIPLMVSLFWGPLAISISGGLFVGTLLTLIVLPCIYAEWFKIKQQGDKNETL